MAELMAQLLQRLGHKVTIAYYATLTDEPDLVVPSWHLLSGRRPTVRSVKCFDEFAGISVGCYMPELEFTYYRNTRRWRDLVREHDRHIAVGGTVLVANPLVMLGVPHMTWCASTMLEDRVARRAAMPVARRIFDRYILGPVQHRMEKRILAGSGRFMAISSYTRKTMIMAGAQPDAISIVPVPVDLDMFTPSLESPRPAEIGFAGRIGDPRKNIGLLLRAISILAHRKISVKLKLTGDQSPELCELAAKLDIAGQVEWSGWLTKADLSNFYRSLDVFVFSSSQEGLGISGIQAMACGVPVVSTRCGGPEDYVVDEVTGKLAGNTPEELANAIAWTIADRGRRAVLGTKARALMEEKYGGAAFENNVAGVWHSTWGEPIK